jgi:hypothetical protein
VVYSILYKTQVFSIVVGYSNTGSEKLSNYLAEKYAGMLTEEDVGILFNLLAETLDGNRSEAARQCGLTGKATYDWQNASYVKLSTKNKVLQASLTCNFIDTVEYLLSRSSDRTLDLLRTILENLYANALESAAPEQFANAYTNFEKVRTSHLGLIRDSIQSEVSEMMMPLREKAVTFGIVIEPKSINDFSSQELLNVIHIIGQLYSENPLQAQEFAEKEIGLPSQTVKSIIETFKNLCFTRRIQTNHFDENKKTLHTILTEHLVGNEKVQVVDDKVSFFNHSSLVLHGEIFNEQRIGKYGYGGKINEFTTRA